MTSDKQLEKKSRLASQTIYEIISREGNEELDRPLSSLGWSGVAAGVCICFSVFTLAYLEIYVPGDENILFRKLGYVAGFLIVIVARLQLFTENTITVILPLLDKLTSRNVSKTFKLWGVVFLGNLAGTFLVAYFMTQFLHADGKFLKTLVDVSMHAVDHDFSDVFIKGIPAGFLIAVMVWMMPSAKGSEPIIITIMVYLIALGDYSHVVAGSFEAFFVMLNGDISLQKCLMYILGAGLGNIVGGTGIFTLLAYAQVKDEIRG